MNKDSEREHELLVRGYCFVSWLTMMRAFDDVRPTTEMAHRFDMFSGVRFVRRLCL